ncbi:MAG: hypothetical protein IMZ62_09510 [Chloroflexi bacterium]|jgi:hypothetical protein|nr:hypothetical protein [Chloroflexota bacterium]MBE3120387.1 hypothetical protein [Candidatus Atribacteria bacterium]
MEEYPLRVRENILPLSVSDTLPEAFDEWFFTGRSVDSEEASETCELCDHEELRYQFQIENEFTHKQLWVGSKCILQFGMSVFYQGHRLSPREAKKKLDQATKKMRLESCLKVLERLEEAENNSILRNALDFYRKNKYLTPKYAFVVFWKMKENGIDHSPSFFKVNLRRERYREDLETMATSHVHMFWLALTPSQRQLAVKMGHSPPGTDRASFFGRKMQADSEAPKDLF